jgi:hypothetical protein
MSIWLNKRNNDYTEFENPVMKFVVWLSFPQLIVINWCIDTVQVEPFDIRDHYLESDMKRLAYFNSDDYDIYRDSEDTDDTEY